MAWRDTDKNQPFSNEYKQRQQHRKETYTESTKRPPNRYQGDWQAGIPKYDWTAISKEYIRGIESIDPITGDNIRIFPSLEDVANKYDCNTKYLKKKANQEKWFLQRTQFLRHLKEKDSEINLNDLLGITAKFDAQTIETLEHVHTITNDILRPYVLAAQGEDIDTSELKPLTTTDLRNLVATAKEAHTIIRSIVNEDKEQQKLNLKEATLASINAGKNKPSSNQTKNRIKQLTAQLMEAEAIKAELNTRRRQAEAGSNDSENQAEQIKREIELRRATAQQNESEVTEQSTTIDTTAQPSND